MKRTEEKEGSSREKRPDIAIPGDTVAIPEEFLPGKNVYETEGFIKAELFGRVVKNLKTREVHVRPLGVNRTPSVGDDVTGQIEVVQTNSSGLKIDYLNGRPTGAGFSGTIFFEGGRGTRGGGERPTYVKLGDIVRAKVMSTLNGLIQLSIADRHYGVIYSVCSNCGSRLTRAGNDGRSRCQECGSTEERKFADDFGRGFVEP